VSAEQAVAFLLFALVAAITPGPSTILLASVGAVRGIRHGISCPFGVALGMGFMMFVVAFGLGSVVVERPFLLELLKWGGAGFLLWLAWKIATAGVGHAAGGREVVGFWGMAAFQWVSPKSWLVSVSAAGTYLDADSASAFVQSLAFGALFVLAALPSCFVWLAFGASLQRLLRSPRVARPVNLAMGALLAASTLVFLW
jgi:threonine/homoserine/homoserine lactone efflux protein